MKFNIADKKIKLFFLIILILLSTLFITDIFAQIPEQSNIKLSEEDYFYTEFKPLNLSQIILNKMIKFFYMANGIFFSHFICFILTSLIFLMVNSERKRTSEPYYLFLTIAFFILTVQRLLLTLVFGIEVIKKTSTSIPLFSLHHFLKSEPTFSILENIPEQFAFILLVAAFLHQIIKDKNKIIKGLNLSLLILFSIDFIIILAFVSRINNSFRFDFNQHWGDPVLKIVDSLLLLTIMITIMNTTRHAKYFLMSSYSLWFLSKYLNLYATITYGEPTRYFRVLGNTLPIIIFVLLTMALYRHIAKENVELEREILDSKDKLQAIFDGITDGIVIIDKNFNILNFNDSEKFILDKEVDELLMEKCYIAYKRGNEPCPDCPALQTFKTGKVNVSYYTGARKPGGKKIHYDVYSFPIINENKDVTQTIVYIKDVTDTKNMLDKMMDLDRLAAIGEMATRVAHEIRNPLDAISGSAAYLSKTIESDIVTEFTNIIMEETDRLFNLTSNLLTFAKPMPPNVRENDINTIIKDTFKVLRAEIDEASINTKFDLYEGLPKFNFDSSQIKQAIMNLVINALDAMPDGGILSVKTYISTLDAHVNSEEGLRRRLSKQEFFLLNYESSATIDISDSGKGIEIESMDKLFKPFFTTKAKGSGLGLAITEKIIKNHYGTIEVKNNTDKGSTFTIQLPIQ